MLLQPIILAVRAIGSEFASRLYRPVIWTGIITFIVLISIMIWLVNINGWWWLAFTPVILAALLFAFLSATVGFVLSLLKPRQTAEQRLKVTAFVDALQMSAEVASTPRFFILFRLVKDVVRPSEHSYVKELSTNATTLRTGLQEIIKSFQ